MKPTEFLLYSDHYNTPSGEIVEALQRDVVIRGESIDYEILSYYYDENIRRMVLDIQPKKD